uniref:ATPase AAA-type core domain-containing protein n=1 Tax=viral metagenome TaxID=1070528 RepID=A0A6C0LKR0_9ZZZZ
MNADNKHISAKNKDNAKSKNKPTKNKDVKKKNESSDDESTNEESEEEMDKHEFNKFLAKIFPSKYLNEKVKAEKKHKKVLKKKSEERYSEEDDDDDEEDDESWRPEDDTEEDEETEESETEDEEEEPVSAKKKKTAKPPQNKKKEIKKNSDKKQKRSKRKDDDEEEEEVSSPGKSKKVNIIFTIGRGGSEDYDDDDEYDEDEDEDWETDDDSETEDENVSVSSSSDDDDESESEEEEPRPKSKNNVKTMQTVSAEKDKACDNNEFLKKLNSMLTVEGENHSLIKKCIDVCEETVKKTKAKQDKKTQKTKDKNLRIFRRIITDKNVMNDFTFYQKLEVDQQKKILKELREINKITRIDKPYRMTLLEADVPPLFKSAAMKKINTLRHMDPGSGEFYKIKHWVDAFMNIPFGKYKELDVNIDCGVEKCHEFMENAKKTLDEAIYGLNDAKMQIMQMLGQLITNPKSIGSALAIHGPPGTGKTSLVKEGISKILNRPFAFIALGGATDSSFLEGHGYTYEGSTWGKIVQILIDSKCMNPVIYFDELDKISDTPKGEEIAGILTHLTDTSQNSQFHDKYFSELDFDLSKCLFIFSYNDESKINPILKDRMYRIETKGYNLKQKTVIGNNYLLPKIREQIKFKEGDINIPDETLNYIIDTHCNKEDGVRNMKRCLEIIHTKLNLYRLMKPDTNLFEEDMSLKVEFPFTVTKAIVDKLIKKDTQNISALCSLYV